MSSKGPEPEVTSSKGPASEVTSSEVLEPCRISRESVLYFSIHRYEYGRIWPHLTESSETAVGQGIGEGYNINVPWNQFMPQLVLVSAGFDSGIGDPKGKMVVTPPCFAILTHMLQPLANGKLILALEGLRGEDPSACELLGETTAFRAARRESSFHCSLLNEAGVDRNW
ncbi:HDAC6 deacetylase, partial [Polypterus senegalus]